MLYRLVKIVILMVFLVLVAGVAVADVTLRFAPADTTVELGTTNRLSIMCDDVLDLRTIEVFVQFDPAIVGSVGGGPGTLYTETGFNLFSGFELTEPDVWHGYCVIMGADDFITSPGELFYWEFDGLAEGMSPITAVSIVLVAPGSILVPDLSLPPTTITVDDPLNAVSEIPRAEQSLQCFPNPFNPRTEIRFELASDETVELSVFDLAGRKVALLHQGPTSRGIFSTTWDGRDDEGNIQPGGMYLFRLETPTVTAMAKGVLVK